jgi:hypothetical protein
MKQRVRVLGVSGLGEAVGRYRWITKRRYRYMAAGNCYSWQRYGVEVALSLYADTKLRGSSVFRRLSTTALAETSLDESDCNIHVYSYRHFLWRHRTSYGAGIFTSIPTRRLAMDGGARRVAIMCEHFVVPLHDTISSVCWISREEHPSMSWSCLYR